MKKKKGSSFIFVLVTFAVMTTFGFSILSLTLVSYKKRFVEVSEKRNQYFSEAGIDIAYGIIGKTVDIAIQRGNEAVKEKLAEASQNNDTSYLNDDGSLNETKINNDIFRPAYQEYITNHIIDFIEKGFLDETTNTRENNYDVGNSDKPFVHVVDSDGNEAANLKFNADNSLTLNLIGTFASNRTEGDENSGNIKRKVAVKYVIAPTKYNKTYYVKTAKIPMNLVWQKAISADGSLNVQGDFNVDGNVYIQGTSGGVNINGNSTTFSGIVATNGDFRILSSGSNININGNLFARNVSIDGTQNTFNVGPKANSTDFLGSVYTNNDLEISGQKSQLTINGGFYGLNDKNDSVTISGSDKPNVSSSILINTDDNDITSQNGTKINIGNKAVIMGVGYIKADPQYESGESIAIKGNYKAYVQSLTEDALNNGKYKEDKVYFQYMSPLTLVKGFIDNGTTKDMIFTDKSKYFNSYSNEFNDLNLGGVNNIVLPNNIISAGAVVSAGSIIPDSYTSQYEGFVRRKQTNYSRAVYRMENITDDPNSLLTNDDLNNSQYDNSTNGYYKDYIDNACINTVSNQVNFNKITGTINMRAADNKNIIYLNSDPNKVCYIVGSGVAVPSESSSLSVVNLNNMEGGVIVTAGNVHLIGNINNFKGTIISAKDVIVDDGRVKKLTYDSGAVKRIIADNYQYFNGVFNDTNSIDDYAYKSMSSDMSNEANVGSDTIRNKQFITMQNWKLLK